MTEKEICPQIFSAKISNFNHSTGLSCIYHDQMYIMEQAATKIVTRIFI